MNHQLGKDVKVAVDKVPKNVGQDFKRHGRDLNQEHPTYNSQKLPLQQNCSAKHLLKCIYFNYKNFSTAFKNTAQYTNLIFFTTQIWKTSDFNRS
jgi:hypothetical protein